MKYIKGEDNVADGLSRQATVAAYIIEPKYTESQKIQILSEYHLKSGHGSISNMEF